MTLKHVALVLPEKIDLVAVEAFESLLRREYDTILDLGRELGDLRASASELERRAREERVDHETAEWMFVRFHQFLERWRSEEDTESDALVAAAEQRAAQILRKASGIPLSFAGALGNRRVPEPVLPDVGALAIRWTAPAAPAASAVSIESPVAPPATEPTRAEERGEPPVAPVAPVAVEVSEPVPWGEPPIEGSEHEFWSGGDRPKRRRSLRRLVTVGSALRLTAAVVAVVAAAIHFG